MESKRTANRERPVATSGRTAHGSTYFFRRRKDFEFLIEWILRLIALGAAALLATLGVAGLLSSGWQSWPAVAVLGIGELAVILAAHLKRIRDLASIERRVNEEDQRHRDLFEHTVEGVFETIPHSSSSRVNPALLKILGYESYDELLTQARKIPEDLAVDSAQAGSFLQVVQQKGAVHNFETQFRRKDGSTVWVSVSAITNRDAGGSITSVVGFVQDIGERKRLEARMIQAQKMEAVGRLAGGIAHDFNNLLTVIYGHCDRLSGMLPDQGGALATVAEIKKAAQHAAELTHQLLAYSRQQVMSPKVLDLNAVIADLVPMLRRVLGENIEVVTWLDENLNRIKADPTQMRQVLMNLAVNARDAMPDGGRLSLTTRNHTSTDPVDPIVGDFGQGDYVRMDFADTGTGISPWALSHLFEPFFTTKEMGRGTGLGLSTSYGIVRQSGGNIFVSSVPGQGTNFTIVFPAVHESAPSAQRPPEEGGSHGSSTVLLVEDDPEVRQVTTAGLRSSGFTVLEAENGEQAVQVLRERADVIDVAVIDIVMPGMSGYELAEVIRQNNAQLPLMFVSGYSNGDTVLPKGLHNALFLPKPYSVDHLARQLGRIGAHSLRTRRRQRDSETGAERASIVRIEEKRVRATKAAACSGRGDSDASVPSAMESIARRNYGNT